MTDIPPPPSINESTKTIQTSNQSLRKLTGKILCRLGVHKEIEISYVDSHDGDDSYCGCERCGRILD